MKITLGNPAQQGRQLVLLAVLTVTAAVLLWNQFGGATAEVTGGTSNIPAAAARGADSTAALPEGLRLAALEPAVEAPLGARDPFGFGEPPRPAARLAPPAPPVTAAPPEALRPAGPKPLPLIPVKFLGFAEDLSRPGKLVSLSVNGSVVLAREGDVVDGRYRLIKVGLESIVMSYLDGQGQQTIRQ